MATRNIVPRATGEGSIGTTVKRWLNGFFDNITLGRVFVNNNEMSPIDDNSVNLGAALKRWASGFFKNLRVDGPVIGNYFHSEGNQPISLSSDAGKIVMKGSSVMWDNALLFRGSNDTDLVKIGAFGDADEVSHVYIGRSPHNASIKAWPDGRVEIYDNEIKIFETSYNGIKLYDDGGSSAQFAWTGAGWTVRSTTNGAPIDLCGYDSNGVQRNIVSGDPDGESHIYYNGVAKLTTKDDGIYAKASAHGAGSTPRISNTVYGTGSPPSVGSVPEGTVFYKYI